MLNLVSQHATETRPLAYAEAVSRLASVRHALRLVDPFGSGPASDLSEDDEAIAAAWNEAGEAKRRAFDKSSGRLVSGAADALEAMVKEKQAGREPHQQATQLLVEQIRRELRDVARVIL